MTARTKKIFSAQGGCACGHVRYQLTAPPLFVHCCHCQHCQRETGGPFAQNAMVLRDEMELLSGETVAVLVPTASGRRHWIVRCAKCNVGIWNVHGKQDATLRYLRTGTLDEPDAHPPRSHIFVRTRQPWLAREDGLPAHNGYYNYLKAWPEESIARRKAAAAKDAGARRKS